MMEHTQLRPDNSSPQEDVEALERHQDSSPPPGTCWIYFGVVLLILYTICMIYANITPAGMTKNEQKITDILLTVFFGVPGSLMFARGMYRCTKSRGQSCLHPC